MSEWEILEVVKDNIIQGLAILSDGVHKLSEFKAWVLDLKLEIEKENLKENNIYEALESIVRDLQASDDDCIEKVSKEYIEELIGMEVVLYETSPNLIRKEINNKYNLRDIDEKLSTKLKENQ